MLALPALDHLAEPSSQQAVATLLDALLEAPALCSPLSGSFAKTAHFINRLLTSHLPHVQLAAHKALVGAACIGPAALRVQTHGLLCHSTVLDTLMTQGLAEADSKLFAAQLVQAVAVEGDGDEGQSCLMPWMVWLACYEHDRAIGGTVFGVINYLQNWRYSPRSSCSLFDDGQWIRQAVLIMIPMTCTHQLDPCLLPSLPSEFLVNRLLAHHMGLCTVQSIHDKASLTPCVYRASHQGFSQWEQAQPHLIGLFRHQPSARQAASAQLAAQLGLTEAQQQLPDKAGNAQVAQDPFAKLLDGGVTAQVTAACASRISSSFRSVLTPKCCSH